MSESAPWVLPASLYWPGEREREGFCGGRGYDQVSEGIESVIFTTKWLFVCCSSSHWVQRDPATLRWQRKQLPRHWRMQACPMMLLRLLYVYYEALCRQYITFGPKVIYYLCLQ